MTPTENQIRNWCDQLRDLCTIPDKGRRVAPIDDLETALIDARRRALTERPTIDGYPSATVSDGHGGAELTSVEQAAERLLEHGIPTDEVAQAAHVALTSMATSIASLNVARSRLASLQRRSDPARPTTKAREACAEPKCEDPVDKGGRCNACYMWRYREAQRLGITTVEVGPVPEHIINARPATRIHVTGPYAEGVA